MVVIFFLFLLFKIFMHIQKNHLCDYETSIHINHRIIIIDSTSRSLLCDSLENYTHTHRMRKRIEKRNETQTKDDFLLFWCMLIISIIFLGTVKKRIWSRSSSFRMNEWLMANKRKRDSSIPNNTIIFT